PCGECESCRSFAEGRSYCIHELDAASNNSVEDIRTLTDQVRIPPQIGRYSVYIIDEVHMLSQAAFNAFLKTLEEPPEYAIFILATTEKHKILPTILSRCQTYDFNRIRVEDIVRNLKDIAASENVTISDDALHIIAQKADGAMRDALTLFDQTVAFCGGDITYEQVIGILNVLDYEYYFRLTDMFLAGDFASALVLFDEILSKGFNALHFISGLSSHLRDLVVCKTATSRGLLEMAPTIAAKYDQYSARCQMGFLYQALDVTTSCEAQYKASGNPRLLIEFALIKIARLAAAAPHEVASPQPEAVQGAVKSAARPVSASQPEQVPSPKPVPALQPEPRQPSPQFAQEAAPKPAPAATKAPGVSIKDLMSQASAAPVASRDDAQEESVPAGRQPSDITEEILKGSWDEFLGQIEKPNLRAALAVNKPQYSAENNAVTQFVASELQKNWIIEKQLLPLQAKLQKALGVAGVRLQIEVLPQSELPKNDEPYMPTEMAKAMMKESSQMENFSREFELEVS
ncbi:MAG: DNA polymerase III subunit gamma/tau, partial [Bacteroidales bacterium]|nr:DNA polymerase III subunit gamma/tau [Bacteroidales bacterium]